MLWNLDSFLKIDFWILEMGFTRLPINNRQLGLQRRFSDVSKWVGKIVNIYEMDEQEAFSECSTLRFEAANEAWLDFVSDNRRGMYFREKYDLIYGPVANDDVYTTFMLYTTGVLTKAQTLEALKIKKLYNQLVLGSEKALSYLRFLGIVPEEEM